MVTTGSIFQISVSHGGVPKRAVPAATVDLRGITSDTQHDRRNHGHPEQALCLYSVEQLAALHAEGHEVFPGCTGENITTLDLDWRHVVPGARLRLGDDVVIEITGYAAPCWKNARWFRDGDFSQLDETLHRGRGRAYARVLSGGQLREGDQIAVLPESAAERVWRLQPRTFRWPRDAGQPREPQSR
jgi:MOSC domain-containing protein YiiM